MHGVPAGALPGLAAFAPGRELLPAELLAPLRDVVTSAAPLERDAVPFIRPEVEIGLTLDVRAVKLGDGVAVIVRDASERRLLEREREQLRSRLMRVYDFVIAARREVVRAQSVEGLFQGICNVAVELGGFALAWVGLLNADRSTVLPVAASGATSYLDEIELSLEGDIVTGRGPIGTAIREQRAAIANEIETDWRLTPWRDKALEHGLRSAGSFPLLDNGQVAGVLTVYMHDEGFFTEEEVRLLEQLADDMLLAMRGRENEAELKTARHFIETVTDSLKEGILAVDREGRLTYMNRAAEELLGWTEADLLGGRLHEAIHYRHEDGTPFPAEECGLLNAVTARVAIEVEDDTFVRKDGTMLPVAYSGSPITEGGAGGHVIVFSDVTSQRHAEERRRRELDALTWVGRVRDALDEDRFVLYAQPIVDIRTRKVVSHELLLRMVDHQGIVIGPGEFLPAAERFGLIVEIDAWVVGHAVALAARGHDVHFNLSGESLGRPDPVTAIVRTITDAVTAPGGLMCEITETALASDPALAEASVQRLAQAGCGIALDDFGTGYGGFAQLKRLPVGVLKIDGEFVRGLRDNDENQHVVRAIVNLAQGLGKRTVAEGIEDDSLLPLLAEYQVDLAQGFALGRPMPLEAAFGTTDSSAVA
jgi:PAS domain S-box-containing protein